MLFHFVRVNFMYCLSPCESNNLNPNWICSNFRYRVRLDHFNRLFRFYGHWNGPISLCVSHLLSYLRYIRFSYFADQSSVAIDTVIVLYICKYLSIPSFSTSSSFYIYRFLVSYKYSSTYHNYIPSGLYRPYTIYKLVNTLNPSIETSLSDENDRLWLFPCQERRFNLPTLYSYGHHTSPPTKMIFFSSYFFLLNRHFPVTRWTYVSIMIAFALFPTNWPFASLHCM